MGLRGIVNVCTFVHHLKQNNMTTVANNTEYKSTTANANGNTFSFLQATGTFNYISVRKETNNPFKSAGKEFKTWEEVEAHYKSADMQIAILCAKSTLSL